MMGFKVGDKVKILEMSGSFTFPVGTIGTVTSAYDDICYVYYNGDQWAYMDYKLKLIKKAPKPTEKIRNILNRHISNYAKMKLIAEVVASNQT